MSAQDAITIAGAITVLLQVLKAAGLSGRLALLSCAVLSAAAVGLWGYSVDTFSRETLWEYFAGWCNVFAASAGIFGIVNKSPEVVTEVTGVGTRLLHSLTGTGSGK